MSPDGSTFYPKVKCLIYSDVVCRRCIRYCALHYSPDIIRIIKSRRLRWTGHVAHMGRGEVLTGKPEGRRHLKDPGVDGRIILK